MDKDSSVLCSTTWTLMYNVDEDNSSDVVCSTYRQCNGRSILRRLGGLRDHARVVHPSVGVFFPPGTFC